MAKTKKLAVGPVDLEVDRALLIESINLNGLEWQIDKTVEALTELQVVLLRHKRNLDTQEQVCLRLGNVFIQIAILGEIFGIKNIQKFIYSRQEGMLKRNKSIRKKTDKVGFRTD